MKVVKLLFISLSLIVFNTHRLFAFVGEYSLEKEKIEFRIIVENDENVNEYEVLSYKSEEKVKVYKKNELSTEDIDFIKIEESAFKNNQFYQVMIYFKKESWSKVRKATRVMIGRKLGIVKDNSLMYIPLIRKPVDRVAILHAAVIDKEINDFLRGFKLKKKEKIINEKDYELWLEQWIKDNNDDYDAADTLSRIYIKSKPTGIVKAIKLYEGIKGSADSDLFYSLGDFYFQIREFDKAVINYKEALKSKTDNEWRIRFSLAQIYRDQEMRLYYEELERSLNALENSKEKNDMDKIIRLRTQVQTLNAKVIRKEKTIVKLIKMLEEDPDNSSLRTELIKNLMSYGRSMYARAITLLEKNIEQEPEESNHYFKLGYCYAGIKEYDKSNEYYKKALELNSENSWIIREKLAQNYKAKGDLASALNEINASLNFLDKSSGKDKKSDIIMLNVQKAMITENDK